MNENRTEQKCAICDSESFFLKSVNKFNIFKCRRCGLEFTHPMPTKRCLENFYNNQYYDFRAQNKVTKRNAVRNLNFLQNEFSLSPISKILDYGCGNNMFVEICRQNDILNSFGYDQYIGGIEDEKRINRSLSTEKKWEVITLWGVLEHLPSPAETLSILKKMLTENGLIVLTTIYIEGKIPFQHKPPEHTLYFTKQSLKELADSVGLSILRFDNYIMEQNSDIYLSILLRTMPDEYKKLVKHNMPEFVEVPTNEVRLVLRANSR